MRESLIMNALKDCQVTIGTEGLLITVVSGDGPVTMVQRYAIAMEPKK